MREIYLTFDDETDLHTLIWNETKEEPKAVVVISHGMAEHIARYNEFAEKLNEAGFLVYGASHYAHGKSSEGPKHVGIVTKYDFMEAIIKDIKIVRDFAAKENPNLPIYLFGHSMGSMASQEYVQLYPNDFTKLVLSGTDLGSIKYKASAVLTKLIMLFHKNDKTYKSNFVENLSNGAFNKVYKNERPTLGWLSANPDNIEKYCKDPYCGMPYPVSFYNSLSKSLVRSAKNKNIEKVKAKVFLISGDGDPVSNMGKSVMKLENKYIKNGVTAQSKLIHGARHESMNELPELKNEFIEEVIQFLNK